MLQLRIADGQVWVWLLIREQHLLEDIVLKVKAGLWCGFVLQEFPLVPVKETFNSSAYQDILDNFMLPAF